MTDSSGQIMTVLGEIAPEQLGRTHMHEHLLIDFLAVSSDKQSGHASAYASTASGTGRFEAPLTLENVYDARRNPFAYKQTLQLNVISEAVRAMNEFRYAGGSGLVEVTPMGVGRDPEGLREIALASGVTIVMGTGFYVHDYQPASLNEMAPEQIAELIVRDFEEGTGVNNVRPGIVGEVGLTWPMHPDEVRSLTAATLASKQTGMAITVHPGRNPDAPMAAVKIVEAAGGDPSRLIIGHIDRTLFDIKDMIEVASTGALIEFDLFGLESSYYPLTDIDMPNDATRVEYIAELFAAGFGQQVTVGQDCDTRTRYTQFGGEGYQHIISHVIPVMLRKGLSTADVDQILVQTPRRMLTLADPA